MTDIVERLRAVGGYFDKAALRVVSLGECADEITRLRGLVEALDNERNGLWADKLKMQGENAQLREALKPLSDVVRITKESASYNRHKREHCIPQSIWSSLCDQEKHARAAIREGGKDD